MNSLQGRWVDIVFVVIIMAIIGKKIFNDWRKKHPKADPIPASPTNKPWFKRFKEWWEKNELLVVIAFLLFHLVGYAVATEWWVTNILLNWKIVLIQLALVGFRLMIPGDGKPIHQKLAKAGWVVAALAIPVVIFLQTNEVKALPPDITVQTTVEKFWETNIPGRNPQQMIAIAEKETQFNQFEKDGITPLRSKRKGHVCVMQLEEEWWAPQAEVLGPDYDMSTLDGCLQMALWVREHMGVEAWSDNEEARKNANHKPIRVVAPVSPAWSEKIALGNGEISEDGPIVILRYDGQTSEDAPGIQSPAIYSPWAQFQSRKEDEKGVPQTVNVTVSRK